MQRARSRRRLHVRRETLRTIGDRQLARVAGGTGDWGWSGDGFDPDPSVACFPDTLDTVVLSTGSRYC